MFRLKFYDKVYSVKPQIDASTKFSPKATTWYRRMCEFIKKHVTGYILHAIPPLTPPMLKPNILA